MPYRVDRATVIVMPKKGFNGQIGLRCSDEMSATLKEIERTHRIAPIELARGLVDATCQFYRQHGWFSFPVVIQPEAFQRQYIAAEAAQAPYIPGSIDHVANAAAVEKAADDALHSTARPRRKRPSKA